MKKCLLLLLILFSWNSVFAATSQFQTKPLNKGVKQYIMQKYKIVNGKKLVLYEPNFLSASCPYIKVFVEAFKKQRNRSDLKKSYSFQQQILTTGDFPTQAEIDAEFKKLNAFVKTCGPICIVNTKNNWIYSIGYPGVQEAQTLSQLFTSLKSK